MGWVSTSFVVFGSEAIGDKTVLSRIYVVLRGPYESRGWR
jgi:hypothetical protein